VNPFAEISDMPLIQAYGNTAKSIIMTKVTLNINEKEFKQSGGVSSMQ